jgi:hypothetical protein
MNTPAPSPRIGGLSPDAFSSVLQAVSGLRNQRALVATAGCMFAGVLAFGLFSVLAARMGVVMGLIGALCLFVASATGVNAAGVLLMDQARGVPSRSVGDAIADGLACIPKFILLGLALIAAALVVFVGIALAYALCKIPLIGPVLFVAVFPLSVVIAGLTLCGLFLCLFLALPAIWEGASITRAIAQALSIARTRLVESILLMALVGALSLAVGFIVFGVLVVGLMPTLTLSTAILDAQTFGGLLGMMRDRGESGDALGSGYALAAGVGAGLLWALAGSLLSLVNLMGLNLVYLRMIDGLDSGATEAALKARLDEARRQATDLGRQAKEATERGRVSSGTAGLGAPSAGSVHAPPAYSPPAPGPRSSPREAPSDSTMPAMVRARACPQCLGPVGRDDVYCGACGHRLK